MKIINQAGGGRQILHYRREWGDPVDNFKIFLLCFNAFTSIYMFSNV
jgi:hypothetical protein